jgi:hypothetical protein
MIIRLRHCQKNGTPQRKNIHFFTHKKHGIWHFSKTLYCTGLSKYSDLASAGISTYLSFKLYVGNHMEINQDQGLRSMCDTNFVTKRENY